MAEYPIFPPRRSSHRSMQTRWLILQLDPIRLWGGYSPLLAEKLKSRPYTSLFKKVYGQDAFSKYTPQQINVLFSLAVAAYESTGEVNAFSSKYDASKYGMPSKNLYTLSASEERGRQLYFGQAQCFQCHSSAGLSDVMQATKGKETFTLTFHKITPGEGERARVGQSDLRSGSMLICPGGVSDARLGQ
jgi:cytochrome c peroxidase